MKAEVGIIGGSGFYELLKKAREVEVETPYGVPSSKISLGMISGRKAVFLPRHGVKHEHPPHKISYRANLWALKNLGVRWVMGPCAAGSLSPKVKPGDFVVLDQFVDRTRGRKDTFFDGPETIHVSSADPYCPMLRRLAVRVCQDFKIRVHEQGTVVVVNGPRFSTRSESLWFASQGWEVINMTQYPEVVLARELELCYVGIALITDYDVGLEGMEGVKPVMADEVARVFKANNQRVKRVVKEMVKRLPKRRRCICSQALKGAEI